MTDPYDQSVTAYELLHATRGKDYAREAAAVAERIRRRRPDARTGSVFSEAAKAGDLAVSRVSRSWREGDQSVIEMLYTMATPHRTWSFTELHRMGLFTVEQQLEVYRAAGFTVEHETPGLTGRGLIVAVT